jgi:predicted secreted protein
MMEEINMADSGYGGTLKIGTYTVSEMTNIGGMGGSADMLDSTTHDSTTRFRTFVKGIIESGEISIDAYFNYNNCNTVSELLATTSLQSITVTYPTTPSATQFACNGHVSGYEVTDPFDDLMGMSINVKISGKPTISKI